MAIRHYPILPSRWWWLVAIPALVIGAVGLLTYHRPPTTYGTTLRFSASLPPTLTDNPGFDPSYYSWLTSEYIVGGLSDWVKTNAFATEVSEELSKQGKEIPPSAVQGSLASDYVRSQLVIFINGDNANDVSAIANAAITVLQTRNAETFPQLGGVNAVVTALDAPAVGASSPGLRALLDLPIRLALGLAVGVALAFAAHYFDPFVRDKREIESLGLHVLAEIPKHK
jgi:capsular polysaccharide biosynthesis protein